jgi:hypothetical protein
VLWNVSRETSTIVDKYYHIYEGGIKMVYTVFTGGYVNIGALSPIFIHNPSTIFLIFLYFSGS